MTRKIKSLDELESGSHVLPFKLIIRADIKDMIGHATVLDLKQTEPDDESPCVGTIDLGFLKGPDDPLYIEWQGLMARIFQSRMRHTIEDLFKVKLAEGEIDTVEVEQEFTYDPSAKSN